MTLSSYQIGVLMLVVLFLPLATSLITALTARIFKAKPSFQGMLYGVVLTVAAVVFLILPVPSQLLIQVGKFIVIDELPLYFGILVDATSATISFVTLLVSGLVGLYATWYFRKESSLRVSRFIIGIGLFSTAMLGLAMSSSLLAMFMFWELMGFTSWWIVGFDNQKIKAGTSATFIFIVNRLADIGFLFSIVIFLSMLNSTEILDINNTLLLLDKDHPLMKTGLLVAGVGIVTAALGKSAQGIFMLWLPRAMNGPTPASALMHAATMVTAGVVLVSRSMQLIPVVVLHGMAVICLVSAVIAGFLACRVRDIKEILALSTIAQVGFMLSGFVNGNGEIPFLHLFSHAFFKSGLFFSVGLLISKAERLKLASPKDLLTIGKIPLNYTFAAANVLMLAALMGLPSTSGFLSKGALFHQLFLNYSVSGKWFNILEIGLFFIGNMLTGAYVNRIVFYLGAGQKEKTIHKPKLRSPANLVTLINVAGSTFFIWYLCGNTSNEAFNGLKLPPVHWNEELFLLSGSILGMGIGWLMATREKLRFDNFEAHQIAPEIPAEMQPEERFKKAKILAQADYFAERTGFHARRLSLLAATKISEIDTRVIDRVAKNTSATVVVFAHLLATLDRFLIDGIVNNFSKSISLLSTGIGKQIQIGKVQVYLSALFFVVLLCLILIKI